MRLRKHRQLMSVVKGLGGCWARGQTDLVRMFRRFFVIHHKNNYISVTVPCWMIAVSIILPTELLLKYMSVTVPCWMIAMSPALLAVNQAIRGWNTSNVTTMSCMFRSTSAFNHAIDGGDTSSITSTYLATQPLLAVGMRGQSVSWPVSGFQGSR